jgi:flagellar assembly protein FliH
MRPSGKMRIVRTPVFVFPAAIQSEPANIVPTGAREGIPDSTDVIVEGDRKPTPAQAHQDAYERGLREGKRQSEEQLKQQCDDRVAAEQERVGALLESVGEQFSMLYRRSEEAVIKFAFGIAQRIIARETSLDKEIILNQIKEGVTRILGVEKIKIRVHPDDLATVRAHRDRIQANSDALREVVVESDEHLECGDCILESDLGNIDARISTQLKQIENLLFESKVVN